MKKIYDWLFVRIIRVRRTLKADLEAPFHNI
jgi:hypothetical protein